MKELTSYSRTVQYLNKAFKLINTEYFNDTLEMPTITIQSTVGAYGHVTTSKVWTNDKGAASYELNIGADYLDRPIENIVATLIHEGCHLYAMQNGIKDTSNKGVYHNKRFKELAEERGLQIERHEKYGWTITSPTEETIDFCIANGLQEIKCTRNTGLSFTGIGTGKAGNGTPVKPPICAYCIKDMLCSHSDQPYEAYLSYTSCTNFLGNAVSFFGQWTIHVDYNIIDNSQ